MSTTTKLKKSAAPAQTYTKPELRERVKIRVTAGSKGGRPGQWSARKAQLVAHEYEAEGGGYKSTKRTVSQQHLQQWAGEKWRTENGQKAVHGETTSRYLPVHVWEQLSPGERKATKARKVRGSRAGQQFVPNAQKARETRKSVSATVSKKKPAKSRVRLESGKSMASKHRQTSRSHRGRRSDAV